MGLSRTSTALPVVVAVFGLAVAGCEVGRAAQTNLHLELTTWDVPPQTKLRVSARARLVVRQMSEPTIGPDGKEQPVGMEVVLDRAAEEPLRWEVTTRGQARESTAIDLPFPVDLSAIAALPRPAIGSEELDITFEISERGADGNWIVARADEALLALPLRGARLTSPSACVRFVKETTGYAVGIAYDCSEEAFDEIARSSVEAPRLPPASP